VGKHDLERIGHDPLLQKPQIVKLALWDGPRIEARALAGHYLPAELETPQNAPQSPGSVLPNLSSVNPSIEVHLLKIEPSEALVVGLGRFFDPFEIIDGFPVITVRAIQPLAVACVKAACEAAP
jgi:hypothetical protein